jgi:hypothetical protein
MRELLQVAILALWWEEIVKTEHAKVEQIGS